MRINGAITDSLAVCIDVLNCQLEQFDGVAFLQTLADYCVKERQCLARWIPTAEDAVDELQLNGIDVNGNLLWGINESRY